MVETNGRKIYNIYNSSAKWERHTMDMKEKRIEKVLSEINMLRRKKLVNLLPADVLACEYKKNNILPKVDENWETYEIGQRFGGYDKHFWIYKKFVTPACEKHNQLKFSLATTYAYTLRDMRNPQCILYINGKMVCGLDLNHLEYDLEPETEYEMYIYLYTGLYEAYYDLDMGIVACDLETEKLYFDITAPFEAALCFDENDYRHIETIKHLDIAVNFLDFTESGSYEYYEGIKKACGYLENNYYGKFPAHEAVVDCIGHTHIDVAWMWTYAQTKEKVQRSFSTVVQLMNKYPEYKFMISQPQLLEYLKEEAPDVFSEIKELVKQGRIDVEGAMWVEADCNLPSGESLIRQIMAGKRYFKEEFGVDSKILWLPDVFGYSASIPQILKKTGINKFVTSKIGWNEYNQIPYDLFKWVGVDGTDISAHFMTCRDIEWVGKMPPTYVGFIKPGYILSTWERQQQKEYTDEVYMTYGHGDGGGGPTYEMLEYNRRLEKGILGIPKTRLISAVESLDNIEEKFNKNCELMNKTPKWKGELYLEFHRGTYTSVGRIKRYNRKGEFLCQNAEKMSVLSKLFAGNEYNNSILDKAWKTLLLNQFHDVIPGSSIEAVYDDAYRMYEEMFEEVGKFMDETTESIAKNVKGENKLLVFNPNGFSVTDTAEYNGEYITVKDIPPLGWKVVDKKNEDCTVKVSDKLIENKFYKVLFDEDYDIISIYDKLNCREVIKAGRKANELIMYEDLPYSYDAWELSVYHKDKKFKIDEVVSVKMINEGARAGFEVVKRFRKSEIVQRIYLYNELSRIDFDTKIDWHQKHIIAKAAFPVDVNANKATYEIQFGNIERGHTENTSWDVAKFETCAHKWADIADNGYGMALANDCKYGYSVIDDSTIQLTLLRCGNNPTDDDINDQGEHIMSYSVMPHKGNYIVGDIVRKAYSFNNPLIVKEINNKSGELPEEYSFISTDKDNIIIDTVKKSENGDNIVVRLYESQNIRTNVTVAVDKRVKKVYGCDMLENKEKEIEVNNGKISINVKNFEIITLMLEI